MTDSQLKRWSKINKELHKEIDLLKTIVLILSAAILCLIGFNIINSINQNSLHNAAERAFEQNDPDIYYNEYINQVRWG